MFRKGSSILQVTVVGINQNNGRGTHPIAVEGSEWKDVALVSAHNVGLRQTRHKVVNILIA